MVLYYLIAHNYLTSCRVSKFKCGAGSLRQRRKQYAGIMREQSQGRKYVKLETSCSSWLQQNSSQEEYRSIGISRSLILAWKYFPYPGKINFAWRPRFSQGTPINKVTSLYTSLHFYNRHRKYTKLP